MMAEAPLSLKGTTRKVDVNLTAPFRLSQCFARDLIDHEPAYNLGED